MAVTRSAAKKAATTPVRENPLNLFVWEGTDKRGVKMKGEHQHLASRGVLHDGGDQPVRRLEVG
ncbi:MAG TPA: hypothetical protein VM469_04050 [Pseudoxanthomonas sp.]|nr:hypothetical protein [Pseudoxanthomonas sp.]